MIANAQAGNSAAQWERGYFAEYGAKSLAGRVLCPIDADAAQKWYLASALQGNGDAMLSLSNLLSASDPPDFHVAISWAKAAIKQGNASAAYNLGIIYRDLGKSKMALRWYLHAAQIGDADAHLQIALCYALGQGTKVDFLLASQHLQSVVRAPKGQVAPHTRENALHWSAVLQLMGLAGSRAVRKAREMLEIANAADDHAAANDLLHVIGHARKPGMANAGR